MYLSLTSQPLLLQVLLTCCKGEWEQLRFHHRGTKLQNDENTITIRCPQKYFNSTTLSSILCINFWKTIFPLFFYHLVTERFNLNGKMQMKSISNFIESWIIIARNAVLFGAKFERQSWLHYNNHPPPPNPNHLFLARLRLQLRQIQLKIHAKKCMTFQSPSSPLKTSR